MSRDTPPATDLFSQSPLEIIQRVFSYLSLPELARVSAVSHLLLASVAQTVNETLFLENRLSPVQKDLLMHESTLTADPNSSLSTYLRCAQIAKEYEHLTRKNIQTHKSYRAPIVNDILSDTRRTLGHVLCGFSLDDETLFDASHKDFYLFLKALMYNTTSVIDGFFTKATFIHICAAALLCKEQAFENFIARLVTFRKLSTETALEKTLPLVVGSAFDLEWLSLLTCAAISGNLSTFSRIFDMCHSIGTTRGPMLFEYAANAASLPVWQFILPHLQAQLIPTAYSTFAGILYINKFFHQALDNAVLLGNVDMVDAVIQLLQASKKISALQPIILSVLLSVDAAIIRDSIRSHHPEMVDKLLNTDDLIFLDNKNCDASAVTKIENFPRMTAKIQALSQTYTTLSQLPSSMHTTEQAKQYSRLRLFFPANNPNSNNAPTPSTTLNPPTL